MELVESLDDLTKNNFKKAVMVFSPESFSREYTEESRSYQFTNKEKYFDENAISNSLHGTCLDGTEIIRLDLYLFEPDVTGSPWTIEKIYITEK